MPVPRLAVPALPAAMLCVLTLWDFSLSSFRAAVTVCGCCGPALGSPGRVLVADSAPGASFLSKGADFSTK